MKKTLMAGTALVASGLLLGATAGTAVAQQKKAEKIKLGLGGYMEQWFGWVDEADTFDTGVGNVNNLDQKSDSEIYIRGDTTLDNGIKVGVKWEIEADGDGTSAASGTTGRFDEAMLFVSGSFGRINLGQEDTASELMGYGAPAVGPIGLNKSDGTGDWVRRPSGVGTLNTHNMDLGLSDKHGVSYFSPRVAGFQFGASYHPNANENSDAAQAETAVDHHGMSTAVNYVNKVGAVSVAGYVGFAMKETADAVTSAGHAGSSYENDAVGWGTGLNVGFGGFTVGASYIVEDDTTTDVNWNIGVRYKAGLNAFSVGYQMATDTGGTASDSDDETTLFAIGYERTLGPGVTWGSSIAKVDHDGEDGGGATEDNDGIAVVTGLRLSF